jgi:hypothetical protein
LTTVPASFGKSNEIGTLKDGSLANFDHIRRSIRQENNNLRKLGRRNKYVIKDMTAKDIRGSYDLTVDNTMQYYYQVKLLLLKPK